MATVGERLRREREAHGATIEEVSAATGIRLTYLEALEKDDIRSLPGRAFGKLYIRAYAETLGFDPRLLIDEYDREQEVERPAPAESPGPDSERPRRVEAVIQRWRRSVKAERGLPADQVASLEVEPCGHEVPAETPAILGEGEFLETGEGDLPQVPRDDAGEVRLHEAAEGEPYVTVAIDESAAGVSAAAEIVPRPGRPSLTSRPIVVAALAMGLCASVAWFLLTFIRAGAEPGRAASTVAPARQLPSADPPRIDSGREAAPPRPAAPRAERAAAKESVDPPGSSHLTVAEFGIGQRIVQHDLAARVDRFDQWDVARFWTRVTGGEPGDLIRHVWLREGRVVQSIELELGAADWRTHSRKTLGQPGQWAVEARDLDGRVLARAAFTCEPGGR